VNAKEVYEKMKRAQALSLTAIERLGQQEIRELQNLAYEYSEVLDRALDKTTMIIGAEVVHE
jgi:hypothetical protein